MPGFKISYLRVYRLLQIFFGGFFLKRASNPVWAYLIFPVKFPMALIGGGPLCEVGFPSPWGIFKFPLFRSVLGGLYYKGGPILGWNI